MFGTQPRAHGIRAANQKNFPGRGASGGTTKTCNRSHRNFKSQKICDCPPPLPASTHHIAEPHIQRLCAILLGADRRQITRTIQRIHSPSVGARAIISKRLMLQVMSRSLTCPWDCSATARGNFLLNGRNHLRGRRRSRRETDTDACGIDCLEHAQ
jgi:hypothetical protein